jgi:hypothetical protein
MEECLESKHYYLNSMCAGRRSLPGSFVIAITIMMNERARESVRARERACARDRERERARERVRERERECVCVCVVLSVYIEIITR